MDNPTSWFTERVLPAIVLAMVFGLFSVYVNITGLIKGTAEYRESTDNYRKVQNMEVKILNREVYNISGRVIRLETLHKECRESLVKGK